MEKARIVKKVIDSTIKILMVISLVVRHFYELLKILTDIFRLIFDRGRVLLNAWCAKEKSEIPEKIYLKIPYFYCATSAIASNFTTHYAVYYYVHNQWE